MRALGGPGGTATLTLCAEDPATGEVICNAEEFQVKLERGKGKPVAKNVSKELLYLWDVELPDGTTFSRIPLFDDRLEGYFWDYNNNGLRVAQLRFYQFSTNVGETSSDPIDDTACFSGAH